MTRFNHIIKDMIRDFDNIPIYEDKVIPRVGIVGEILVKFLPQANNHLVELLEREGAELLCQICLTSSCTASTTSNLRLKTWHKQCCCQNVQYRIAAT